MTAADAWPTPTPEELAEVREVPGYPGLFMQRTPNGGANLLARFDLFDRNTYDDDRYEGRAKPRTAYTTRLVTGVGRYRNTGTEDDPDVFALLERLAPSKLASPYGCWRPTIDGPRARNWTPDDDGVLR